MYLLKNTEQTARISVGKPIRCTVCHWSVHCEPIVPRVFGNATVFRYTKFMNTSKDKARQLVQQRLEALSASDYGEFSRRACYNLRSAMSELYKPGDSFAVLMYQAIPHWREVDVSELTRDYVYASFECVSSKKYAPQPRGVYDVVIVPLFGFTHDGYRLGHGFGWYDRFLAKHPMSLMIGVGLEAGQVNFTHQSHDLPMDYIITEQRRQKCLASITRS